MISFPDFKYKQLIIHKTIDTGEKLQFQADNILIVDKEKKVILQHSCHKIFALFIIGEITLTSVIIKHALLYHFPIILMNHSFKVIAKFNSIAEGNTILKSKQYNMTEIDKLSISKKIIFQKISNQRQLIEKLRYKSTEDKDAIQYLLNISLELNKAKNNLELIGFEGNASKIFFKTYYRQLNWTRREPRCKKDIYNLLLDIGYTWLFQFIEALLSLYGFDLYCGVLHTFFYQRKSLVCDLIEPFRYIIDERIRKMHNLSQINIDDFDIKQQQYFLKYQNQKKYISLFLKDILENKEQMYKYIQSYYRWYIKNKNLEDFPNFSIKN